MSELPHDKIKTMLAVMWQRNQPQILARLALLDSAAAAAQARTLTPALRDEAMGTAHKLAGTLGTFGYPGATEIARRFEQELEAPTSDPAQLSLLAHQLRTSLFPQV